MTQQASSTERAARRVPGLRTLPRAATATAPAFDLAYVRTGTPGGPVVLVIPGGPGLAVPLPYRDLRRRAAAAGLDVLMVEHRGVGLSRTDRAGRDLPPAALTIPQVVEDLVAVLDAERVERAIVSGTSYGSYVAAALAVTRPDRLAGLLLDSATLSARETAMVREHARSLLWRGEDSSTARAAQSLRDRVALDGIRPAVLGQVTQVIYEFGGTELLERYLEQLAADRARTTTALVRRLLRRELDVPIRHVMEYDLVRQIAYGELNTGVAPDGEIFDPADVFHDEQAPAFTGESFDLHAGLREVEAPALVLSGERDLRTPPPAAREAAELLDDGVLVPLPGHAHSALDTRPTLLIEALHALADGTHRSFPDRAGAVLARSPVTGSGRALPILLRASLTADLLRSPCSPRSLPRRTSAVRPAV